MGKTAETPLCRLCGNSTESVCHIVSGCRKLAQKEIWKPHLKVAVRVHWELCRKYELQCVDKWYDHQPLPAVENRRDVRITWLWVTILSDKWLKHNRSNITVALKDTGVDTYRYSCASGPRSLLLRRKRWKSRNNWRTKLKKSTEAREWQ